MLGNLKSREENKEYLKSVIGINKRNTRNEIDWVNSIGKEIEYEYNWKGECSEDVLKIVKYENGKVYFKGYKNGILTDNLTKCELGGILGFRTSEFKYEIGDTNNCLTIIDMESRENEKGKTRKCYKYKCNLCGHEDWVREDHLKEVQGCDACGNGISYPEKFMESVLIQVGIKYKKQYKPNWSKNKIYDFYLLDYNTVIEVHGIQHYKECKNFTRRTLQEEQGNDKLKEELALSNEVKHYIVIDCRKSELQYIKNNILDSKLNELFDLSKIDWSRCEEYALKNKVKEVCDYYKKHPGMTTTDLGKEFGMNRNTIRNYLKKGNELGWCKYNVEEEKKRNGTHNGRRNGRLNGKPVLQFTPNSVKTYPSAMEAARQTGISNVCISACCNGKQKTAGGYQWKYA